MTYRDDRPQCLNCGAGMAPTQSRWMCEQCRSALVTAEELEQLMNETSPDDVRPLDQWLLPRKGGTPRACVRCPNRMTMWSIYDVTIERCSEHGVWFDPDELGQILQANGNAYGERSPGVIRPAFGIIPLGVGVILHSVLGGWLDRRRLRKHIERTSPKSKP